MHILQIEHPVPDFDAWKRVFDSAGQAEAMLVTLRELWGRVEGRIMTDPQARIVETVESREY